MNQQDLLDNLPGQKYENGYVVNEEKPLFAKIRDKIILGTKYTRGQGNIKDNEIFVKRPFQKEIIKYRKIYTETTDFPDFQEHREFQKAKRVDLQIQNRLNERLVNQIETSYAPQPTTRAELKALQTSRPQLQKELEAVEEYAKTHYLTEEQKAKLKEDIYKKNYKKWKTGIENVQTGDANEEAGEEDKQEFARDPRLPPVITRNEAEEFREETRLFGDIINLTDSLGQTQLREMSRSFLNPGGAYFKILNGEGYTPNPSDGSINIKFKLFSTSMFLTLLTTNKEQLKNQLITYIFGKKLKFVPQIIMGINQVYQKTFGDTFFKVNYDELRTIVNSRVIGFQTSRQFRRMIDTLYDIFQDIRRKLPMSIVSNEVLERYISPARKDNLLYIDRNSQVPYKKKDLIVRGKDIEAKKLKLTAYIQNYELILAEKRGKAQPEIVIDAGNVGGAAGAGGGN